MGDATQFHCPRHDGPYYSHMIQANEARSSYYCWLVTAATRDDMITFFKGFIKYSKTNNGANITDVKPVHLAWWTFNCPGDDHGRGGVEAESREDYYDTIAWKWG
ncbi:hypothetical protein An04g04960 [Aspergillus niger]|uniref:Uncharacterized protein n=2 Tax=Aspergillus niger TaxID=5061 RepID=A2QIW4_ASPNC|nr:hypothetical protein An04g04960 [Aspergillus niger]CAK38758.1 hypothetical protein An04g04960 [Aspergillus niger]